MEQGRADLVDGVGQQRVPDRRGGHGVVQTVGEHSEELAARHLPWDQ